MLDIRQYRGKTVSFEAYNRKYNSDALKPIVELTGQLCDGLVRDDMVIHNDEATFRFHKQQVTSIWESQYTDSKKYPIIRIDVSL